MLGEKQKLITTADHYTDPLGDKQIMEKLQSQHKVNLTLNITKFI